MSRPLVFEPEVRGEIDEAHAWYEGQRAGLGEEFLAEVQAALDRIQAAPERHALVKRFPDAVYYRAAPDRTKVTAVHHTSRDPGRWQSRA